MDKGKTRSLFSDERCITTGTIVCIVGAICFLLGATLILVGHTQAETKTGFMYIGYTGLSLGSIIVILGCSFFGLSVYCQRQQVRVRRLAQWPRRMSYISDQQVNEIIIYTYTHLTA